MRQIKVRAWDGKEFLPLTREVAFIDDEGVLKSRIEGIIFSLFTGLLDRNGKEIYEGDIIFHDEIRRWPKTVHTSTAKRIATYPMLPLIVEWNKEQVGFDPFVSKDDEEGTFFLPERIEVIGNIWEHSDLLGSKE